jgi:hypothetical protein
MELKIFDFAPLFQVALGMNLAVPFFSDAMNRTLSPVRQALENLLALKDLVQDSERGEYLGEISKLRRTFEICADDTRTLADRLSVILFLFAGLSFWVLYDGSANPQLSSDSWIIIGLLCACFLPPIGSVLTLYLYSRMRSTDVRIEMQDVYNTYIEAARHL